MRQKHMQKFCKKIEPLNLRRDYNLSRITNLLAGALQRSAIGQRESLVFFVFSVFV